MSRSTPPPNGIRPGIDTRPGYLLRPHSMHWWLHSCGNNTAILGDLAEADLAFFIPFKSISSVSCLNPNDR